MLRFGPYELRPSARLLLRDGAPVKLGSRAFDILVALAERPGDILSHTELLGRAWPGVHVDDAGLRVAISQLRKAVGEGVVTNVPGRGYTLTADIAAGRPGATPAPGSALKPQHLPAALTATIGREEVLAELEAAIGQHRLVSLLGPGGMGKTTVALDLARRWRAAGRAVHFVDLGSAQDRSNLPAFVSAALGLGVRSVDPRRDLLTALQDENVLLIMDNCEHLLDEVAPLVEDILRAGEGISILTTSREALAVVGEWRYPLPALRAPQVGERSADPLQTFTALRLFMERARAVAGAAPDDPASLEAAGEICRRLDGVPLALELAAARVGAFSLAEIAARLDDRFALLERGRRTALARHQTLAATLEWSFDLLSASEQATLRRISVFAGRFTAEAAVAVASNGRESWRVFQDLSALVAKSLLTVDAREAPATYRLLETTRAFARLKLLEAGEAQESAAVHAAHIQAACAQADMTWALRDVEPWTRAHAPLLDDLRAALQWLFSSDGDPTRGGVLAASSAKLWVAKMLLGEFRPWLELALDRLQGRDATLEMRLSTLLGHAVYETGLTSEAQAAFERALALAEGSGDAEAKFSALVGIFKDRVSSGDYLLGPALAEEIGAAARAIGRADADLYRDRLRAMALHYAGDQAEADRLSRQVIANPAIRTNEIAESFHFDPLIFARAAHARVLWLRADWTAAADMAASLVDEALASGHGPSIYITLVTAAGPVALWSGDKAAIERVAGLTDAFTKEIALGHWTVWQKTLVLGRQVRFEALSPDEVSALGAKVLPTMSNYGREILATCHPDLVCPEVLLRAERGEAGWCAPEIIRAQAVRAARRGYNEEAETAFLSALSLARHQGAAAWALRAATGLAQLHLQRDEPAQARAVLEPALSACPAEGVRDHVQASKVLEACA